MTNESLPPGVLGEPDHRPFGQGKEPCSTPWGTQHNLDLAGKIKWSNLPAIKFFLGNFSEREQ